MANLNIEKRKEELLNFIRNQDIIAKTDRGVTTQTDNFTATEGQTDFILTNAPVKNIRSVVLNSTTLDIYADYDININSRVFADVNKVTLNVGATAGDTIDIEYDYTSELKSNGKPKGDRIYPDHPQEFIKSESYPRIGFELTSGTPNNRSANDNLYQYNLVFDFKVEGFGNDVDSNYFDLDEALYSNRKNFYWFNIIRPSGFSNKLPLKVDGNNKIFVKNFSYTAPAEFTR